MRLLLANFSKMVGDTGGVAKVHCSFANEMKRRGHDVAMVFFDDKVGKPFFQVDDGIELYNLQHYEDTNVVFPTYLKVKREIVRAFSTRRGRAVNNEFVERYLLIPIKCVLESFKPDIIICWQTLASKIFLCDLETKIPVITMSHGDPEDIFHTYPQEEIPALGKSAACQVLMPSFVEAIKKRFPNMRTVVIGNVVPQYEEAADLGCEKEQYKIIFIGRLVKNHKRPHLLIEAFAKLADDFPDWIVEIWGGGAKKSYQKSLEALIQRADLEQRVFLKGTTHDVASVLQKGDLFVCPSAYEGFSLALTEAMSMGLPAIGYKDSISVNELIQDGITGFLAEDGVDGMVQSMKMLMENQDLRMRMGMAARESMRQYEASVIWDEWESLLDECRKY